MADNTMAEDGSGHDVWTDAVSHVEVDPDRAKHRSFYNGKMYHFADLTNKRVFDEDPQLWVPTAHASEISSHLSPTGEPM